MSLIISRQSWHYRLHVFIRKLWGWKPSPFEQWSLCPYFWTIVFGTLLSLITLVPALIGWTFARLARKAYKSGSKGGIFSLWARFLDFSVFGRMLDKSADAFNEAFIPAGLAHLILLGFGLLVIAAIGVGVSLICYFIATGITQVPHILFLAAIRIGWIIFYLFALLGGGLIYAVLGCKIGGIWLYENVIAAAIAVWGWICSIAIGFWTKATTAQTWIGIGKWILTLASSIILGILGLVLLAIVSSYTIFNEKFWAWAEMKANGYAEARRLRLEKELDEQLKRDRKMALEERLAEMNAESAAISRRNDKIDKFLETVCDFAGIAWKIIIFVPLVVALSFWATLVTVGTFLRNLYSKPVYKNGIRSQQLGPIGVLVIMLFAFKKRACPLIEFADNNDLKDSPHPNPSAPSAN